MVRLQDYSQAILLGFTFKKYDGTNDGDCVDSSGTARVDVWRLQPLATRDESEDMGDDLPIV